MKKSIA